MSLSLSPLHAFDSFGGDAWCGGKGRAAAVVTVRAGGAAGSGAGRKRKSQGGAAAGPASKKGRSTPVAS